MHVQLTAPAEADLFNILEYVGTENPAAAVRVVDEIEVRLRVLKDHPEIGRAGRVAGTRELIFSPLPYLAIYYVDDSAKMVSVLRVLHGAQQWPSSS